MKRSHLIAIVLGSVIVAGGLFAQSIVTSGGRRWTKYQSYDSKTPPPLALPDAYALAIGRLAAIPGATNRFYCISASALEMAGTNGWTRLDLLVLQYEWKAGQRVGIFRRRSYLRRSQRRDVDEMTMVLGVFRAPR